MQIPKNIVKPILELSIPASTQENSATQAFKAQLDQSKGQDVKKATFKFFPKPTPEGQKQAGKFIEASGGKLNNSLSVDGKVKPTFVGRVPPGFVGNDPKKAEINIINSPKASIALFDEDIVSADQVRDAVKNNFSPEGTKAIVQAFTDFKDGKFKKVKADDFVKEAFNTTEPNSGQSTPTSTPKSSAEQASKAQSDQSKGQGVKKTTFRFFPKPTPEGQKQAGEFIEASGGKLNNSLSVDGKVKPTFVGNVPPGFVGNDPKIAEINILNSPNARIALFDEDIVSADQVREAVKNNSSPEGTNAIVQAFTDFKDGKFKKVKAEAFVKEAFG